MRESSHKSYYVSVVCVTAIVGAFSISSLVLVNVGGHLYRSMVESSEDSNRVRSALNYTTERIREMDTAGAITIEKRMDRNVLVMKQETTQEEVLLYFSDGTLFEAKKEKQKADQKIQGNLGQAVMRVESFAMAQLDTNLIQFTATDKDGHEESITLNIRSER